VIWTCVWPSSLPVIGRPWPEATAVDDHLEVRRHVFQNLALVAADPAEPGAAAGRAGASSFVLDPLARQMRRQRLATTGRRAGCFALGWRGRRLLGLLLRLVRLEFADQQLELLDPLRRPAVAGSLQERQLGLQLLDMLASSRPLADRRPRVGLGVELGLQPRCERLERVGIGGQCGRCQRHGAG
jgi:hypothetical protein